MITQSEIKGKKGTYLVYKSKNCFILGKVHKVYNVSSHSNYTQKISLYNGRKITPSGVISKSELVVDLEGIKEHAKENNGIWEFLPEVNIESDFEEKLFVSLLAEGEDNPVGSEYLIASYILENEHKFKTDVIMMSKKLIEQYNRRNKQDKLPMGEKIW